MNLKIIKNIKEMEEFAVFYLKNLEKTLNKASIVLLEGDLGSGKTTFTQQIAKYFEIKDYITSPTFVIQKKYRILNSQGLGFENLIHIDAYRLESGKELFDLEWEKNIFNPKNIIFIEWSERVFEVLPNDVKKINFKFIDEETREISF